MTEVALVAMAFAAFWSARKAFAKHDPKVARRVAAMIGQISDRDTPKHRRQRLVESWAARANPRWVLGAIGALVGLWFGKFAFVAAPGFGYLGYRIPDFIRSFREKVRREEISAELPETVDMLAVCTEAGLNVALSLQRVAARASGALGDELRRTVDEIELGVPRGAALAALAERNGVDDLDALVANLNNSERFGTQVAATLQVFAQEVRAKRRRSAEEQARRAPVKILFPLVFLILPAFVLLTVVPLLLGTFQKLGF
ncbi:MAG: type II secretion system F family protein [Actinomycetota bacterium]